MSLLKNHLPETTTWNSADGVDVAAHFFTPEQELEILRSDAAVLDFSHRGLVAVSGEEREQFIQGLTTNQIKDLKADQCIYSAILSPQGRFLWDFTIVQNGETMLLDIEPGQGGALVQKFMFYLMRTKATIKEVSAAYGLMALVGPKAAEYLGTIFPDLDLTDAALGKTFALSGEKLLWRDPRNEHFGWRLLVTADEYADTWEKITKKFTPAGESAWEMFRIMQGLPKGGVDIIPNKSLPLEAGFHDLNGVSFSKGCFVGQETTARTHHRGTLKKRLFQVILEGDGPVTAETPVLTPSDKEAGHITSAISHDGNCHGLATLRLSDVAAGKQLTAAGRKLTAHKPHWAGWDIDGFDDE